MTTPQDLAARKEHLIAQSDIDRVRLAHAVLGVRSAVSRSGCWDSLAARRCAPSPETLLGYAIPALGVTRARGILRVAAFAVAIVRIMRRFVRR